MLKDYTVTKGDSLWRLANRYLGEGKRWPIILEHHNKEVARKGPRPSENFFAIKDPNLIYVGQSLRIPSRQRVMQPITDEKIKANRTAIPLNLKLKYSIGKNTPPAVYVSRSAAFDIKAEITGEITIEMISVGNYRKNLEITLSRNSLEAKQKLRRDYDPAIRELLSKPKVVFESGKVRLKTPLSPKAQANIGTYTINVKIVTPNHLSGSIAPSSISGKVKADGREYRYSADIEIKVDVISRMQGRPGAQPVAETVKKKAPHNKIADELTGHTTKWEEMVTEKGYAVAVVSLVLYATYRAAALFAGKGVRLSPATMPPIIHEIDYRNDNKT